MQVKQNMSERNIHTDSTSIYDKRNPVQSFVTPTTIKGKTKPMKKKLNQFTDPAMMYAAEREVWVNSSVVKMLVTPPSYEMKQKKVKREESLLDVTAAAEEKPRKPYY